MRFTNKLFKRRLAKLTRKRKQRRQRTRRLKRSQKGGACGGDLPCPLEKGSFSNQGTLTKPGQPMLEKKPGEPGLV